ncbi:hypothetical protein FYK55_15185 [Roseiconus nitratireducens]|uniref:Uncharacterized protein n=1 Tax=Roseiconus nitratireducens TaxID=2605748 RepID=A0A5M6D3T5_9BACT|nr:hypothetical protein [Roseiconus nitratireducens]KAA5542151.1 hypothetical protein FYK55_15185 [Roseiconus nitratireducens]
MSRLVGSVMFAFSLFVLSISVVGCGSENEVIEDTRTDAEIQQEMEDYEEQMNAVEEIQQ